MLELLHRFTLPAAYAVLPAQMASPRASALVLAVALQESEAAARRQEGGPARGFWQFEPAGLVGVRRHHATAPYLERALETLRYSQHLPTRGLLVAIEHNDVLACVFARLLLWTLPQPLPDAGEAEAGWEQYLAAWQPGRPRQATWAGNYDRAWRALTPGRKDT